MNSQNSIFERMTAALGAVALTMTMLVGYFATPEVQAVSGMLA